MVRIANKKKARRRKRYKAMKNCLELKNRVEKKMNKKRKSEKEMNKKKKKKRKAQ